MSLIKYSFFAYLLLIALSIGAYLVARTVPTPRRADTLYTTFGGGIKSFDPVAIADVAASDIAGHVYETLYNYRYGGKTDELFPQLAADFPVISDSGLTYTIPLRHGVRFYDPWKRIWPDGVGPEMTARDVIYSWKRLADFRNAAPSYSTILQGNIAGLDDFFDYTQKQAEADQPVDYDRPVEGLSSPDPYTLVVRLTKPIPNFPQLMAYLGIAIVPRDAIEKLPERDRLNEKPIGTGPYAMVEYQPDQRIVFEANPVYRGAPDVDGGTSLSPEQRLPHIARVQYDFVSEPLPAWYQFLRKRYDVSSIPKDTFSQAINPDHTLKPELSRRGIELRIAPDLGLYYLQFNMTDKVVGQNAPLRQAISLCIDRDKYIRTYLNGRARPATGVLPPDAPLFSDAYRGPWARFDIEAARSKVDQARRLASGTLPKLKLQMMGADTSERQEGEFFAACMRAVGLDVDAEFNTYPEYLRKLDTKDYQIAFGGWYPDYPDEKTYLRLFDATLAKPPGSNTSGYVDAEYQSLLEKSLVMTRSPERDRVYLQLAAIVDRDLPIAPLYYPLRYGLRYNWLSNIRPAYYNQAFIAHWKLDAEARRKAQSE